MTQIKCIVCGTPFPPGTYKCPICDARFVPKEDMKAHMGGIFSKVGEQIEIPLDFWINDHLIFEIDYELYLNTELSDNKKPKNIEKSLTKLNKKYRVQKTSQFEQPNFWYLLKFFFIRTQFFKADPTGIALLIAGVPTQLKIRCKCGATLEEAQWLKGFFTPPAGIPSDTIHEYYLRISKPCKKCGATICIYRPKAGVYISLVMFLSHLPFLKTLYPNMTMNFDITSDEAFLTHWVIIINELLQKNPEKICALYHEDIQEVWELIQTHKGLSPDQKEEMKKVFPFNDFIKQYKDLFRHKGKTILAFLSRGIITILSELLRKHNQEIEHLFNVILVLYNEIGSWIYGDNDPKYIYYPLKAFIDQNKKIIIETFSKTQEFLTWIVNDLNMVLQENNITDPNIMNPVNSEFDEKNMEYQSYMWRSGEMFAMALEVINMLKVPLENSSIDGLEDMFNSLGEVIYGNKTLKESIIKSKDLKEILTITHDPAFDPVIFRVKSFINDFTQFLKERS
ncbi:MAG: hypothetical protein ACFFB0_18650 [Promethearchaeota archaeon]